MGQIVKQFRSLHSSDQVYLGYTFLFSFALLLIILAVIFLNPITYLPEIKAPSKEVLSVTDEKELYINESTDYSINPNQPGLEAVILTSTPEPLLEQPPYVPPPMDCENPVEIKRIETNDKIVVFSFDADGHDYSMPAILSAFKKRNLKTTFFVEGRWAKVNPEFVKAISNDGHEIFNHSLTHVNFKTIDEAGIHNELNKADEVISSITGKSTKPFFRPPYGGRDEEVLKSACRAGYQSVVWNIDAMDWRQTRGISAEEVRRNILDQTVPGAIILMHTGNYHTAAVIDDVLTVLQNSGYQIMSFTDAMVYSKN